MSTFKAKIYSAEIVFTHPPPSLRQFAQDLDITPESPFGIEQDSWGARDSLEIWFQRIDGQKLTLHIQRAHFKRNETYIKDLQSFFDEADALEYVERVEVK